MITNEKVVFNGLEIYITNMQIDILKGSVIDDMCNKNEREIIVYNGSTIHNYSDNSKSLVGVIVLLIQNSIDSDIRGISILVSPIIVDGENETKEGFYENVLKYLYHLCEEYIKDNNIENFVLPEFKL